MRESDRYLKVVEWSEEDKCYIGRSPGLFFGGVHGDDEAKVFNELCQAVEEWIEITKKDGRPLPKSTAGKRYSGNVPLRMDEDLHRAAAMKAESNDQSLNNFIISAVKAKVRPEIHTHRVRAATGKGKLARKR